LNQKNNFSALSRITFLFLVSGLLSFRGYAQQNLPDQAVIGFYNVENLFDTEDDPATLDEEFLPDGRYKWTDDRYRIKLANMSKVLAAFAPDIVGLGEIENRKVLEDLVTHPNIIQKRYQIIHFDMTDVRGIDVALLYRPAVFKPFQTQLLRIHDPNEPDFKTRDILWVKGLFLGDTLHVAVNHWPSRRGGKEDKRLLAAAAARRAVDSVLSINPQANIVLVGDFNDDPNNRSIKKILLASDDKEKQNSLINTAEPTFKKGYGTLAYNGTWNLFDQVIVSASLVNKKGIYYADDSFTVFAPKWMQETSGRYRGMPSRTFRGDQFNPDGYSDHFPVFITIRRNPN
jgi:endonuclease/exonuclease/phosphatase family metal-dependent hydrolase